MYRTHKSLIDLSTKYLIICSDHLSNNEITIKYVIKGQQRKFVMKI